MAEPHDERIRTIQSQFDHAMRRFLARLDGAAAAGEISPGDGKWSAAQIAWHVALVNEVFAGLLAGTVKGAVPARPGFVERGWPVIIQGMPEKLEASSRVQPPASPRLAESIAKLRTSADAVRHALAALTPERGAYTLLSPIVGEISLYQVGEWATAHVIRHNAQAKRVLGG